MSRYKKKGRGKGRGRGDGGCSSSSSMSSVEAQLDEATCISMGYSGYDAATDTCIMTAAV